MLDQVNSMKIYIKTKSFKIRITKDDVKNMIKNYLQNY